MGRDELGRAILIACGLAACAGNQEGPPVLPGELSPTCGGEVTSYLIDELRVPENSSEAEEHSFLHDDDGIPDNRLGVVAPSLQPLPLQATVDQALEDGTIVVALSVERCADEQARVTLVAGSRVDIDRDPPRVHVQGFPTVPAVGTTRLLFEDGRELDATYGLGWFPLVNLVDIPGSPPQWIRADQLFVRSTSAGSELDGSIGFTVPWDELWRTLPPALVRHANALVVGEPGCPSACVDEALARMMELFDDDVNGVIEEDEFRADPLVLTLLRPDVDLFDQTEETPVYWPDHDGEQDSLSVGLGMHAIPAELVLE